VGTGAGWVVHKLRLTDPEAGVRARAQAFIGEIVDLAGLLGAPAIIGSMQGRHDSPVSRDHALGWLGEALETLGARAKHATFLVADIIDLHELPENQFSLTLAMGDPLSICSDSVSAVSEISRTLAPGGVIIATADNKLAALDHFLERGDMDALEQFLKSSRTNWLTDDSREQFTLTMFTPHTLRRLFEKSGLTVLDLSGKTILPLRKHKHLLENSDNLQRLLHLEHELAKDPTSPARASHLQITAQKPVPEP
jgi:SAM-dependent methyltransferase